MTKKEFCLACDAHVNDAFAPFMGEYFEGTYLVESGEAYAIRFPGATRGHIEIDETSVITKVVFYPRTSVYKDIGCYKESILEVEGKFVGAKLEV